ncbi:MAG: hypothetical protein QXJ47_05000, partial [Candidatus Caldarchaeum sp.]
MPPPTVAYSQTTTAMLGGGQYRPCKGIRPSGKVIGPKRMHTESQSTIELPDAQPGAAPGVPKSR